MKHTECEDCKLRKGDCGYHFKMDGKTNYNIVSLSACDQYGNCMFFEPKAKPQGDLISREELKQNKFLIPDIQFVGDRRNGKTIERIMLAYQKGWNDAIDAIYDNAPTVPNEYMRGYEAAEREYKRPQGEWIEKVERRGCFAGDKTVYSYTCPFCGVKEFKKYPFCHCGVDMRKGGAENE